MSRGGRKNETVLLPDKTKTTAALEMELLAALSDEVFSKPELSSVTKPIIPKRTQDYLNYL